MTRHDMPGTEGFPGRWNFQCWSQNNLGQIRMASHPHIWPKSCRLSAHILPVSVNFFPFSGLMLLLLYKASGIHSCPVSYPPNGFCALWPQTLMKMRLLYTPLLPFSLSKMKPRGSDPACLPASLFILLQPPPCVLATDLPITQLCQEMGLERHLLLPHIDSSCFRSQI